MHRLLTMASAFALTFILVACGTPTKTDIAEFSPDVLSAMASYQDAMIEEIRRLSPATNDVEMLARAVAYNLEEERQSIRGAMKADNVNYFYMQGYFEAAEGEAGFNQIVTAILEYRSGLIHGLAEQ